MRRIFITLTVAVALSGGCAGVKPWQREEHAKPEMQPTPWPQLARGMQHVLQVREASRGAYGSAGGGCGCN